MNPSLALSAWLVLLLALLCFDPAKKPGTSPALWVPLIWMFIAGSRLPSQWLGGQLGLAAETLEEGSPLDRVIFSFLILLTIGILMSRSFKWGGFFSNNVALMAFLIFALVSICWSDFAFVSFKRWFRDLGNYLVILVPLSDARPMEAVRTLLRRLCYLLIPLSILLIKYYPLIGVQYNIWSGGAMYVGPTTSKNGLGFVCLVSGLFFFWDTVTRWSDRAERRKKSIMVVNITFIAMTLWLMYLANSATSRVCLSLGCLLIWVAHSKWAETHPSWLKVIVPACLCIYPILAFGFNMNGELAGAVGRDPTLTGRTDIWKTLLSMHTDPLLGVGYDSFWLGPRLQWIWQRLGPLNEAHNGYLEIYFNLGLIGLCILIGFLIASYRTVCRKLTQSCSLAPLSLAVWTIVLFYNITESAIKGHFMWVTFLLMVVAVPGPSDRDRRSLEEETVRQLGDEVVAYR